MRNITKIKYNIPFTLIAGPCSIESYEQIYKTAEFLSKLGVKYMRGGAFKPRTSPYSFQGLGIKALKMFREVADKFNMKIVSEITDYRLIDVFDELVDIIQVGARNAQNFVLLKELAKLKKPILFKRGLAMTIEEWLNAAEYLTLEGNDKIILCERGIRTFEKTTRFTVDLNTVAYIKKNFSLPIIVDPSHATGIKQLVEDISLASALIADGLLIEVHPKPEEALSDVKQQLNFDEFEKLYNKLKIVLEVKDNLKKIDGEISKLTNFITIYYQF